MSESPEKFRILTAAEGLAGLSAGLTGVAATAIAEVSSNHTAADFDQEVAGLRSEVQALHHVQHDALKITVPADQQATTAFLAQEIRG